MRRFNRRWFIGKTPARTGLRSSAYGAAVSLLSDPCRACTPSGFSRFIRCKCERLTSQLDATHTTHRRELRYRRAGKNHKHVLSQ